MTSTIPPFGRGVLAVGQRVGRHFHAHVLGVAIIREQLHDDDVMIEHGGAKVTRMRTERRQPVPRPRVRSSRVEPTTDVIPVTWPIIEPSTSRIIFGFPFRTELPPAR